jgi:hypothetical protein
VGTKQRVPVERLRSKLPDRANSHFAWSNKANNRKDTTKQRLGQPLRAQPQVSI